MISEIGDFTLSNINFNAYLSDQWKSPLMVVSGGFATMLNNPKIAVTESFSWIGAVYQKAYGDGPLFEWDDGNNFATHIWISGNKFYVNVVFEGCSSSMSYSRFARTGERNVYAMHFNFKSKHVVMWVNGEMQVGSAGECSGNPKTGNNLRVNHR